MTTLDYILYILLENYKKSRLSAREIGKKIILSIVSLFIFGQTPKDLQTKQIILQMYHYNEQIHLTIYLELLLQM